MIILLLEVITDKVRKYKSDKFNTEYYEVRVNNKNKKYSIDKYGVYALNMALYTADTGIYLKNWFEEKDNYIVIYTLSKKEKIQKEILIDKEDYELVKDYYWGLNYHHGNIYAESQKGDASKKKKIIKMHSIILNNTSNFVIDHKNKNGLDNRKRNLRLVTNGENQTNKIALDNNNTGIIGLTENIDHFYVRINNPKTQKQLIKKFYFKNEDEKYNAFLDALEFREKKEIEFDYLTARYREEQRLYNLLVNIMKGMIK